MGRVRGRSAGRKTTIEASYQPPDSSKLTLNEHECTGWKMRVNFFRDTTSSVDTNPWLHVDGKFMSAFVRAVKPKQAACCGPSCCN